MCLVLPSACSFHSSPPTASLLAAPSWWQLREQTSFDKVQPRGLMPCTACTLSSWWPTCFAVLLSR